MTRTIDDVSYSHNRRPENRRIYAEQQIDWAYAELLKAQHRLHTLTHDNVMGDRGYFLAQRSDRAERDLAEAHERHLKACAALGPAKVQTWRDLDSPGSPWSSATGLYGYRLRDACGFIRAMDRGYATRMSAALHGHQAAINLGLEVK